MTRDEWDAHEEQHFKALFAQHPEWSPIKRQRLAREETERLHGPRPAGTGLKWALVKLGWGLAKGGGDMDFSWTKNLWKAVRGALGVALAAAIYAALEVLMQNFDTSEELTTLGAPQFAIPLILALLVSLRNFLKHKKHVNMP